MSLFEEFAPVAATRGFAYIGLILHIVKIVILLSFILIMVLDTCIRSLDLSLEIDSSLSVELYDKNL